MLTELHVSTTGESFSFRPVGEAIDKRQAIFQALKYGDVLVIYGVQGEGYFKGIVDHFDEIAKGIKYVMGYVFERHVNIYRRALRGKAIVEVLFQGKPYGADEPTMSWVLIKKNRKRIEEKNGYSTYC